MPSPKLTNEIIIAAIEGFQSQKHRIDDQIAELRAMLPGGTTQTAATPEAATRKRKKFSAAARRHMKEAQQLRWSKTRGESEVPAPASPEPAKPKRNLSATGRANIVKALKKRWAAKKAAAKTQSSVAKKTTRKKVAAKKAPAKTATKKTPARAPKTAAPVKKLAVKKSAPAPTQAATETGAQ